MRWLLDQGLARSAAELLCLAGHDAVHVGEIGLADATDTSILNLAALSSAWWLPLMPIPMLCSRCPPPHSLP